MTIFLALLRRSDDWRLSWGGCGAIYGWGHNHRGQLGGVEGAKVRLPTVSESLSALHPVQLVGGEQTLIAVTPDGKVYATGKYFFLASDNSVTINILREVYKIVTIKKKKKKESETSN